MSVQILREGARLYFAGETYPMKSQIKAMGGHWDGDRKQWWVGAAKAGAAQTLVDGLAGNGGGVATATAEGQSPAEKVKEDPSSIRLVGKAKYKGRTYYCRWVGECKGGEYKAHLVTLDQSVDFWAKCARPHEQCDGNEAVAVIVKTYSPREYRGRLEYTTLGSIKRFIERQANPGTRRGECTECGAHGPAGESCSECGGEGSYV